MIYLNIFKLLFLLKVCKLEVILGVTRGNLESLILLEKQKFLGYHKNIINLFNRNHNNTVNSVNTLNTLNTVETPNTTPKTEEIGIQRGMDRRKNVLMKFGNKLKKYEVTDQTNSYPSSNTPDTPNTGYNNAYTGGYGNGYNTGYNGGYTGGYGGDVGQGQNMSPQPVTQAPQPMTPNPMGQTTNPSPVNSTMAPNPVEQSNPAVVPNPANPAVVPNPMGQYPGEYPNQYPQQQYPNQYPGEYPGEYPVQNPYQQYQPMNNMNNMNNGNNGEKDIHDSWKCMFFAFFFPECSKPTVNQAQNQAPPPSSPLSQQYCNTYSNTSLNDFVGAEDWLMLSENNLTCLTRSRPADFFQFITLKNFCNQLKFKCYVQMGENSIGGLMIRCNGPDKTLIELNSVTKTISLKLLKSNHTLTLLELPHRGIEVGLNHLLEVSDDGSGGVVRVMIDGEEVFVKENLPTQLTGSMGIYITTGNVTFGNITILPL